MKLVAIFFLLVLLHIESAAAVGKKGDKGRGKKGKKAAGKKGGKGRGKKGKKGKKLNIRRPTPAPSGTTCENVPDLVEYNLFLEFESEDVNILEQVEADSELLAEIVKNLVVASECRFLSSEENCIERCLKFVNFEGVYEDQFFPPTDFDPIQQNVTLDDNVCNAVDESRFLVAEPKIHTSRYIQAITDTPSSPPSNKRTFPFHTLTNIGYNCNNCAPGRLLSNDGSRKRNLVLQDGRLMEETTTYLKTTSERALMQDGERPSCDADDGSELPPILRKNEFTRDLREALIENGLQYLEDILIDIAEESELYNRDVCCSEETFDAECCGESEPPFDEGCCGLDEGLNEECCERFSFDTECCGRSCCGICNEGRREECCESSSFNAECCARNDDENGEEYCEIFSFDTECCGRNDDDNGDEEFFDRNF